MNFEKRLQDYDCNTLIYCKDSRTPERVPPGIIGKYLPRYRWEGGFLVIEPENYTLGNLIRDDPESRRIRIAQALSALDKPGYAAPLIEKGQLRINRNQHNGNGRGSRGANAIREIADLIKGITGVERGVEVDMSKLEINISPEVQEALKKTYKQFQNNEKV